MENEIRIIHAADLHLDSPFSGLDAEQAALRRREQRALLDRLAALCDTHHAQLLLLAGDLFDSGRSFAETGEALLSALTRIRARVFIAPGNHDWYAPGSPWHSLALPEHVHIFRSNEIEAVPLPELGCTVYGAGFTGPEAPPLLRGFSAPADGMRQVMVLHGALGAQQSPYNPITEQEIAASGLDYLALGHVHAYSGLQRCGGTSWCYPGCTEGRGFDETGEKGAVAVTLGAACTADFIPLASRRYAVLPVDLSGAEDASGAVLAALPDGTDRDIYRILLTGEQKTAPDLVALYGLLAPRFFALELRDRTRLERDVWAGAEEDTLRGLFLARLLARYERAETAQERDAITLAARYGLAALEGREGVFPS